MTIVLIGTLAHLNIHFRGPLLKDLVDKGYKVYAFAFDYNEEQKNVLRKMGVEPMDYGLSRNRLNPVSEIILINHLRKTLKAIQPDVVFSYFIKPVIYGTLAAKLAGVKHRISMLEGLGFVFTRQPEGFVFRTALLKIVQVFLYNIIVPLSHTLIFLNKEDQQELLPKCLIQPKNAHILGPIGLELDHFFYQPPNINEVSFLFMGRLVKEKGINEFLQAASIIKTKYPEVSFLVIGKRDTVSQNCLAAEVLEKYMQDNTIEYGGEVYDVRSWLARSSVFVLPSYREGYSRSTQEAMAVGRPILTTHVPGCKQTVVEGKNGFVVPAFDVQALVEKMMWFIENKHLIKEMGLHSRKFAELHFDVHQVNQKLMHIFEDYKSI